MSAVTFRPCIPSDAELAVPLIYSSGPDAFNYVFKTDDTNAQDFLRYAFVSKGGEFSYANHTAVISNGQLVGVGSGFSGKDAGTFTFHDAFKILKYYKLEAPKIWIRGLQIEQKIKLPKKHEVTIGHLGIAQSERGKGYGTLLIEHLMNNSTSPIETHFVLDVSEINNSAQKLYEKLGFKVQETMLSDLKHKHGFVMKHYRMVKAK